MANSESARKRIRQNEKNRERNVRIRSRVRTTIRGFVKAVEESDVAAAEARFKTVESLLDRAVLKGVIPKKRASRKTSRLAQKLNALRSQAS